MDTTKFSLSYKKSCRGLPQSFFFLWTITSFCLNLCSFKGAEQKDNRIKAISDIRISLQKFGNRANGYYKCLESTITEKIIKKYVKNIHWESSAMNWIS